MKKITLTVQSTNLNWRLGLNTFDSKKYFHHRENINFILPKINKFSVKTACGKSKKKAYDFNGKIISHWILKNNYHIYKLRKPTKLDFELINDGQFKTLKFIKKKPVHNTV